MTPQVLLDWLGRVLMAALFVKAVPGKLTDFSGTVDVITSKGIAEPLAGFLLASAINCLILGSVVFVFGTNTRLGASLLLVFLAPTMLIFHTFPVDSGFFMNLALIGALFWRSLGPVQEQCPAFVGYGTGDWPAMKRERPRPTQP